MATVKKETKTEQKPILETKETKTPDSIVSETADDSKAKNFDKGKSEEVIRTPVREIKKSRKRTPIHEFAAVNSLRNEVVAGFQVWLDDNDKGSYHFDDEWVMLFDEYNNRKLKGGKRQDGCLF